MADILAQLVAQIVEPVKLVAAYLIYRKNPRWLTVVLLAVAVPLAMSGIAEAMSAVPMFDILIVPSMIGSLILFAVAKLVGQKRYQKTEK